MTPSERPLLSIIIPSYNQGRYLRETIESVLAQSYRPIEVLIIDGASRDETLSVLESYRGVSEVIWASEPDRGVVDAVNKGLARARGESIAIQSSDDVYLPGAFDAAMEALADPTLGLAYGDIEFIDSESRPTGRTTLPAFDLHRYLGKLMYIPQPAAFFRASAAREAGPWREEVSYAADADFFLRIALRWKARKIDRVLARYRYHESQRDKESTRVPGDWARVVEPWTRDPDARLRRIVRSGIWLTRFHYTPRRRWLRRAWYAYRTLLSNPALLRHIGTRELIPGHDPIWRFLSRLKRAIGLPPRR